MEAKENTLQSYIPKRFPITDIIWVVTRKSRMQVMFFLMFILLFPLLAAFLKEVNYIVEIRKLGNPLYSWPQYSDFWITAKTVLVLFALQSTVKFLALPFTESSISEKYQGRERHERAKRQADSIFKGCYFVFAFVFGYIVAKDSYFLPTSLGGKGEARLMFKDFPYQSTEGFPLIREYLLVQLGYHTHSFIVHVFSKPRNDFIEMLLHHSMTVFLISLAYLMNYVTTSLLVLFSHDLSDILVYGIRMFVDTNKTKVTFAIYILLVMSWAYTRLFIFPTEIIYWATYQANVEIYGLWVMGAMLHFLLVLHIYWFCLLIKMGVKFIKKGRPQDTQHDLGS